MILVECKVKRVKKTKRSEGVGENERRRCEGNSISQLDPTIPVQHNPFHFSFFQNKLFYIQILYNLVAKLNK